MSSSVIDQTITNYAKYRGKCKELSEQAVANGPSVEQFPTNGIAAEYEEYDGIVTCEYCHLQTKEEDAYFVGHHVYCSYECYGHDVGF